MAVVAAWRFLSAMVSKMVWVSVATVVISVVPKVRVRVEETTMVVGTMTISVATVVVWVTPTREVAVEEANSVSTTRLVSTGPAPPPVVRVTVEVKTPLVGTVTVVVVVLLRC